MTTPLLLIGLATAPWVLAAVLRATIKLNPVFMRWAGLLGITLVFCFTGIGHFVKTEPMVEMIPAFLPARLLIVYVTGVIEIILAIAVLHPSCRKAIGVTLLAMLLAFLPINIYAAVNHIEMGGHAWGPVYLLIRIPLQLFLLYWVWQFAVRRRHDLQSTRPTRPA